MSAEEESRMKLNPSRGNMYENVTHTGTAYEGCDIGCPYCWATLMGLGRKPRMLLKKPFEVLRVRKATVFINSAHDFLAPCIPDDWVETLFGWIGAQHPSNRFYLQSKNIPRIAEFLDHSAPIKKRIIFGTTIETNKSLFKYNAPSPMKRAYAMKMLKERGYETRVSFEPLYDFDLETMKRFVYDMMPDEIMAGLDNYAHRHKQVIPQPRFDDWWELRKYITLHLDIRLIEKKSIRDWTMKEIKN